MNEKVNERTKVWQQPLAKDDAIHVIHVQGRIDQNLTSQLEQQLNDLLDGEHYNLIVNMEKATYINSGGLRTLVSAWRKTRQQGGNLILYGLNQRLHEIFTMVGFDKVFNIYENVDEAHQAMVESMSS